MRPQTHIFGTSGSFWMAILFVVMTFICSYTALFHYAEANETCAYINALGTAPEATNCHNAQWLQEKQMYLLDHGFTPYENLDINAEDIPKVKQALQEYLDAVGNEKLRSCRDTSGWIDGSGQEIYREFVDTWDSYPNC